MKPVEPRLPVADLVRLTRDAKPVRMALDLGGPESGPGRLSLDLKSLREAIAAERRS